MHGLDGRRRGRLPQLGHGRHAIGRREVDSSVEVEPERVSGAGLLVRAALVAWIGDLATARAHPDAQRPSARGYITWMEEREVHQIVIKS